MSAFVGVCVGTHVKIAKILLTSSAVSNARDGHMFKWVSVSAAKQSQSNFERQPIANTVSSLYYQLLVAMSVSASCDSCYRHTEISANICLSIMPNMIIGARMCLAPNRRLSIHSSMHSNATEHIGNENSTTRPIPFNIFSISIGARRRCFNVAPADQ